MSHAPTLSKSELFDASRRLSEADRFDLFYSLWDELLPDADGPEGPSEPRDEAAWKRELCRRVEEHRADPSTALEWPAVRSRIAAELDEIRRGKRRG